MDYTTRYQSPVGGIIMASDGEALTGLWFDDQKHVAVPLALQHEERDNLPIFDVARRWLDIYFSGQVPDFTPKLAIRTTPFRKKVWEVMLTIPYGSTMSYGDIAKQLGCKSAQAVGGAVGHNSIAIIIPCHRVIGTNGTLIGYAGGLDKKQWLLQMEALPRILSTPYPAGTKSWSCPTLPH